MSLSPLYSLPVRRVAGAVTKERARVPVVPVSTDAQPSAQPIAPRPRVEQQELTVDTARALSIETLNMIIPTNPGLVAELIVASGKRRRAELAMSTFAMRPLALAIVLCGKRRRAEPLSAADEQFLADYLAETDAS